MSQKVPPSLKAFALILLVFQTTTLVLTMRFSQIKSKSTDRYLVSTAVVMGEVLKLILNLIIIFGKENKFRLIRFLKSLYRAFITDYKESLKITITAAIYTVQNNLLYLAAANLDAATYQVSYQSKILTTAVFSVILPPGKKLSGQKWVSLVLLTFGVVLVQLNKLREKEEAEAQMISLQNQTQSQTQDFQVQSSPIEQNFFLGLIAIFSAAVTSGFAGIYFERVMKGGSHSMWFRNLESAVFSIFFGLFACYKDLQKINEHPDGFFQNYDNYTWAVIFLQATGGMIIVAVVNYTDNIIKCFANACSILTSALASYFILNDFKPTGLFLMGALVVCFSVFLYTSGKEYICRGSGLEDDLLPRYRKRTSSNDRDFGGSTRGKSKILNWKTGGVNVALAAF